MSLLPYEKNNCTIVYVVAKQPNTIESPDATPSIALLRTCRYELEKRSPFWRTFITDCVKLSSPTTIQNVHLLFDVACGIPAPVIQLYMAQVNVVVEKTCSVKPLQTQIECLHRYAFTHLFPHFEAYLKFICFLQDFVALHVLFTFLQQFIALHPDVQSGTYEFLWKMYQCVRAHQFYPLASLIMSRSLVPQWTQLSCECQHALIDDALVPRIDCLTFLEYLQFIVNITTTRREKINTGDTITTMIDYDHYEQAKRKLVVRITTSEIQQFIDALTSPPVVGTFDTETSESRKQKYQCLFERLDYWVKRDIKDLVTTTLFTNAGFSSQQSSRWMKIIASH